MTTQASGLNQLRETDIKLIEAPPIVVMIVPWVRCPGCGTRIQVTSRGTARERLRYQARVLWMGVAFLAHDLTSLTYLSLARLVHGRRQS